MANPVFIGYLVFAFCISPFIFALSVALVSPGGFVSSIANFFASLMIAYFLTKFPSHVAPKLLACAQIMGNIIIVIVFIVGLVSWELLCHESGVRCYFTFLPTQVALNLLIVLLVAQVLASIVSFILAVMMIKAGSPGQKQREQQGGVVLTPPPSKV